MNQVFIRSDKGEYLPGEYVCGAVYLDIKAPSEAHGVQLSFRGEESVCCELHVNGVRTNLHAKQDYVDYCHTDLYIQNEPFVFGSYCFPFRLRLPHQIPGTFKASCTTQPFVWSACVMYQLHAHVAGAEILSVSQDLVVTAMTQEDLHNNYLTKAEEVRFVPSRRLFGRKTHVMLKLHQNFLKTGENLRLHMIFANENYSPVSAFSIKLLQTLMLSVPSKSKAKEQPKVSDKQVTVIRNITGSLPSGACSVGKPIILSCLCLLGVAHVYQHLGWRRMDNIMIPLKMEGGQNVLPSIHGKFIQCEYSLEVNLLAGKYVKTILCPIPGVLPLDNYEWRSWRPLPWFQNAEVKLGTSPITPTDHLLESGSFSRLPRFQDL